MDAQHAREWFQGAVSGFIHPNWLGQVIPPSNSTSHPSYVSPLPPTRGSRPKKGIAIKSESSPKLALLPPSSSTGGSSWLSASDWPALGSIPTSASSSPGSENREPVDNGRSKSISLDRHAAVYQPLWLRSIPRPFQPIPLGTASPFPTPDYPPPFILDPSATPYRPNAVALLTSILALPPIELDESIPIKGLDAQAVMAVPDSYALHFTFLLSLFLSTLVKDAQEAIIFAAPLRPRSLNSSDPYRAFSLSIPGIREDTPRLFIGDSVFVQGLDTNSKKVIGAGLEAEVVGMLKRTGEVFVRSPYLDQAVALVTHWDRKSMFQVSFKATAAPICVMQDAIRRMETALRVDRPIASHWLFPEIGYAPVEHTRHSIDPQLIDPSLNAEQADAVVAIATSHHQIPYLLDGPPGTGKTKTLVAAILAILEANPNAHVLACAPSNPATDTIAHRLTPHLGIGQMFRLNPPNRTFEEVPSNLLQYCRIEDDKFTLPSYDSLMKYQVVVTSCLDAAILFDARAANVDCMSTEISIAAVFHPDETLVVKPHWTHLLVDEAGQASEPEVAVPLTVIIPPPTTHVIAIDPVVVLCGDSNQLGPIIPSAAARQGELDVSLLERLFEREVYASHPLSRRNIRRRSPSPCVDASSPSFCHLVRNYRSLPEILMVPSTLFYEDTLVPAATDVRHLPWSGLPNPSLPVAFIGCETEENSVDEGASWYNPAEIKLVVTNIQQMLQDVPDLRASEIAVVTPWREQVWRMREALRKANLYDVDVGNVETYQGREFRVTIISCVRSSKRFISTDHAANMGLIFERKRFNVAITRAKELLVIIGNASCLSVDPFWNGFLQFCLRNDLYRGPSLDVEDSGGCMSQLEIKRRREENLSLDDENLTIASAVAQEALNGPS